LTAVEDAVALCVNAWEKVTLVASAFSVINIRFEKTREAKREMSTSFLSTNI
jgi:hypothetical protein